MCDVAAKATLLPHHFLRSSMHDPGCKDAIEQYLWLAAMLECPDVDRCVVMHAHRVYRQCLASTYSCNDDHYAARRLFVSLYEQMIKGSA